MLLAPPDEAPQTSGGAFARQHTAFDTRTQRVEMGKANRDVCGSAIAHLLRRAYQTYGE